MESVVPALMLAFCVVFVAELGDKSQLMALCFATRFRPLPVLAGIAVGAAAVHGVSVAVGHGLGAVIPTEWINLGAGVAFLGFAGWTLRGGGDVGGESESPARERRSGRAVAATVGTAFFVAELGDKTMVATIALATRNGWLGTWLGATAGMVAVDAIAVLVGVALGQRLPAAAVRYGAAALFACCGIWMIGEYLLRSG